MSSFKKTEIIRFPDQRVDPGGESGWGPWKHPVILKEYGAINKIDISPVEPNYLAITSYSKVLLYNPVIKSLYKTLTKFQDAAFGAKFRRDGKLLCVGTTEGQLKVFDVATKTQLRVLQGHTTAVHRCDFTPDNVNVLSFSDDKTVGLWDLPSETRLETFEGHEDYVRCGAPFHGTADLFVSASYDQTVRMWDRRVGAEPVLTMKHSAPVEDVLVMPGDGMIVSAGGNKVTTWDIAGGGRELVNLSPHHKTVTSLCVADEGRSLVTGSLDRQVKRIDMQSFQVTGSLSFPSSVLSVGVLDGLVVGGMIDGLVQIHEKREEQLADGSRALAAKKKRRTAGFHYLKSTHFEPAAGDIIVDPTHRETELKHDTMLRKYEYSRALDLTLKPFVQKKKPEYAHGVMYELIRREGLKTALVGRDEKSLILLLTFINRFISDTRFSKVIIHAASLLVDIYLPGHGMSDKLEKMFKDLERKLERELRYIEELAKLQGVLDLLIASASAGKMPARAEKEALKAKS